MVPTGYTIAAGSHSFRRCARNSGGPAALAAKAATTTIPIVVVAPGTHSVSASSPASLAPMVTSRE
jgi:hypothetical protein